MTPKSILILSMAGLIAGLIGALVFDVSAGWEILTVVAVLAFLVTLVTWLFMRPATALPWLWLMVSIGMMLGVTL